MIHEVLEVTSRFTTLLIDFAMLVVGVETSKIASPASWVMVMVLSLTPGAFKVTIACRDEIVGFVATAVNVSVIFPVAPETTESQFWLELAVQLVFELTSSCAVLFWFF